MMEKSEKVHPRTSLFFTPFTYLFVVFFFIFPLAGEQRRQVDGKLHVLLITIDTLRPDRLSCYGSTCVKTPRIDAIAGKGILFERAFAHDPMTLPSHANIFLGMTALAHGVDENSKSVVAEEFQTLAEILKNEGYETGAFVGAFPVDSRFGLDQGFDIYDDMYPSQPAAGAAYSERTAEKTIKSALDWLSGRTSKWFCWVHIWDPHFPYMPPEPFSSRFKDDPYSGEVAFADQELGRIFDEIERRGWSDRTLVVLTGDHGESLGEHGENTHSYFAYNSTIWVPLIISGPDIKSSRVKEYVSHVDIFSTVCDVLGIKKPASIHGQSLEPFLRGKQRRTGAIYFEAMNAHKNRGWAPLRGVLIEGKKFIDLPIPELYDLETDFNEKTNLAPQADISPFRKKLEDKMKADSSPLSNKTQNLADRETLDKLRSLGYTASPVTAPAKETYGPEDDLKSLLHLEQKLELAVDSKNAGRIPESVRLLEDIIGKRNNFIKAYENLYQIYISQGLIEEGLQVLKRGFDANPENFTMVSNYGGALIKQGREDRGAQILEQALFLFDMDPEVWNLLGVAYWKRKDFDRALDFYQKALSLDPGDAIININIGSCYVEMAQTTANPEAVQKSVAHFKTAIADDPMLASAYNGLGGAMKLLGNVDEAVANWKKTLELDPLYAISAYNLAYALLEKGDKKQALKYALKYLALRGNTLSEQEKKEMDALIRRCKY
jgi:arylsulfatase A-like enzyme/Flp pilus assembly protein TadD